MLHRSKTAWRRLTTLLVIVFSLAAAAGAQVEQGRFVGHIQDPTGAIVEAPPLKQPTQEPISR